MNANQYIFYKNINCNLKKNSKFKSLLFIYLADKNLFNFNRLKFYISCTLYNRPSSYVDPNGVLHTLQTVFCFNNEIFYNSYTSNTYGIEINSVPSKAQLFKTIECGSLTIKLYDYC